MSIDFYKTILPPIGPYCAVGISGRTVIHTFHNTFEELIQRGQELDSQHLNPYFALASFTTPTKRTAENAKALSSLFLDLDCGEGKDFESQSEAHTKLQEFCESTGLPTPVIVSSGRGLHVYWPLTEPLPTEQWRSIARRFKQLCISSEFKIDTHVPADAARVLRMPGTHNFKDEPPKDVVLLTELRSFDLSEIEPKLPAPMVDLSEAKLFGMDDFTKSLGQKDYPTTSFVRLVRRSLKGTGCAQIAHAVKEASTLTEPLWRAALSIAWRCIDGEESIHTLSRPHPDYNPDDTVAKAEKTKGPMTCEWYRLNNPNVCAGCTHRITSPIQLGVKVEEAPVTEGEYIVETDLNSEDDKTAAQQTVTVTIPAYPAPYFRPINGGVYKRTKDKDGDPVETQVYPYDIYLTSRFYDYDDHGVGDGELVGLNIHSPHDGIRRLVVPVTNLLVKEKLRDLLLRHGVAVFNTEDIMAYFASSFRKLQQQGSASRTRNQMGWTPDMSGFVVGELEYTLRGTLLAPASAAARDIAPHMVPKGSLEEWTNVVNFYAQPGMEAHAFVIFAGFGAPLLRLIGGMAVKGAAINLMSSKSGTGKTTAQMVVNSIFGHPSGLLMRKNDTTHSKMQWIGTLNTIAATMDEVTNMSDEALSELIYDIPQGRGRHRMEAQSNRLRVNTATWMTFLIMSSNSSLYDKLMRLKSTADGELRRLIEIRIERPTNITKAQTDQIFNALNNNYGVAGPAYIKYIQANLPEVTALALETQRKIDEDLKLDQSDRYYSIVLACIFAGAAISSKLRLHSIPIAPVYEFGMKTMGSIRTEVVAPISDPVNIASEALGSFVNENLNFALVINKPQAGIPAVPIQSPRGPLKMRYEPDTEELWIPVSTLREYFVDRQVDVRQALKDLNRMQYMKNDGQGTAKRLSAGAIFGLDAGPVRAYCFDAKAMGLKAEIFVQRVEGDTAADAPATA